MSVANDSKMTNPGTVGREYMHRSPVPFGKDLSDETHRQRVRRHLEELQDAAVAGDHSRMQRALYEVRRTAAESGDSTLYSKVTAALDRGSTDSRAQSSGPFGYDDGKLKLSFGSGAALGLGARPNVVIEVDLKMVGDLASSLSEP